MQNQDIDRNKYPHGVPLELVVGVSQTVQERRFEPVKLYASQVIVGTPEDAPYWFAMLEATIADEFARLDLDSAFIKDTEHTVAPVENDQAGRQLARNRKPITVGSPESGQAEKFTREDLDGLIETFSISSIKHLGYLRFHGALSYAQYIALKLHMAPVDEKPPETMSEERGSSYVGGSKAPSNMDVGTEERWAEIDPATRKKYAEGMINGFQIRSIPHLGFLRSQNDITYSQYTLLKEYMEANSTIKEAPEEAVQEGPRLEPETVEPVPA